MAAKIEHSLALRHEADRRRRWLANRWVLACLSGTLVAGCASVPMDRFEPATRIDVVAHPGFAHHEPRFQAVYERIRRMRVAVCRDPAVIAAVYRKLAEYPDGWTNYWAAPPESPPVLLIFHSDRQWLGTLDVYEGALGHVHNLIRKIPKQVAADLLEQLCTCAEVSDRAPIRDAYR